MINLLAQGGGQGRGGPSWWRRWTPVLLTLWRTWRLRKVQPEIDAAEQIKQAMGLTDQRK